MLHGLFVFVKHVLVLPSGLCCCCCLTDRHMPAIVSKAGYGLPVFWCAGLVEQWPTTVVIYPTIQAGTLPRAFMVSTGAARIAHICHVQAAPADIYMACCSSSSSCRDCSWSSVGALLSRFKPAGFLQASLGLCAVLSLQWEGGQLLLHCMFPAS